jgi:outer membrane protein W
MSFNRLLIAAVLFAVPVAAQAQEEFGFQPEDWELTLGGSGANDSEFEGSTFAFSGSLGYFFTENVEVALRQTIGYSDIGGSDGSAWNGSTRVAADWHFDLERWQPFVGVNGGYLYGETVADTFIAGPEAGVKFFLNETTFIQFSVEYQFFFDDLDESDDTFDDGQFVYGLSLGVRL